MLIISNKVFGIIMGTSVARKRANLYLAMLEQGLDVIC
jgi:hypothetical protein